MEKLELNKEYDYNTIKAFFSKGKHVENEHGNYLIGENFLVFSNVLSNNQDTHSFVLTGATGVCGIYKLIYKENEL